MDKRQGHRHSNRPSNDIFLQSWTQEHIREIQYSTKGTTSAFFDVNVLILPPAALLLFGLL